LGLKEVSIVVTLAEDDAYELMTPACPAGKTPINGTIRTGLPFNFPTLEGTHISGSYRGGQRWVIRWFNGTELELDATLTSTCVSDGS
jgi:hypothetical protein